MLASNSPRRRELLGLCDWEFRVSPANVDERHRAGESPTDYVTRLAVSKARASAEQAEPGWLVLAADTIVVDDEKILGKPAGGEEAAAILQELRGHSHQVYTALAVLRPEDHLLLTDLCVTTVPMRTYSDEEIAGYIASGDPMDKAGAYAIQHPGFHPVERLSGCYASVMGLPLCHLVRSLNRLGIHSEGNIPAACQAHLSYHCPVSTAILRGEPVG